MAIAYLRTLRFRALIAMTVGLFLELSATHPLRAQTIVPMPDSGSTSFGDWRFSWEIGDSHDEGLVLRDVRWKDTLVLSKASMPVVRVKYRGDSTSISAGCGPYSDRIHSGNISRVEGATTDVTARVYGSDWMELAVFAEIGAYDLYQAYYFGKFGRLEPMLYSRGWSCSYFPYFPTSYVDHWHHPYWRLDFDVGGVSNRVSHIRTDSAGNAFSAAYSFESGFRVPFNTSEIVWTVSNPISGRSVRIQSPMNESASQPADGPWYGFAPWDVHVRRWWPSEDVGWDAFSAISQLGYSSPAEDTDTKDVVFWAIGHLSHYWTKEDETKPHWHSRGWIVDAMW